MILVFISALLFGLVHPGSKLILGLGVSLVPFCLLYISIRLLVQLPFVLTSSEWKIKTREQGAILILLGLVGAALQFSEFYGIADGLPVSVVSFLVYTHPMWTLVFSRFINGEPFSAASFVKVGFAVVGVYFVTGAHFESMASITRFAIPLAAGVMIALWVTVSHRATKFGCTAKTISFYYDLFAFATLLTIAGSEYGWSVGAEAINFMQQPKHAVLMIGYSILIGLIPNLLFYQGSRSVPAFTAGLILLLEPVISTLVSVLAWNDVVSISFVFGALCILLITIPLPKILTKIKIVGCGLVIILILVPRSAIAVPLAIINVVEIVPSDPSNFTVSAEINQLSQAFNLAEKDFRKSNPSCSVSVVRTIRSGTEEELHSTVKHIAETNPKSVMVGFTRSTFARIAAHAAAGTPLRAIAIGASTTNLKEINPNFVSIASPRTAQWEVINKQMKTVSLCTSSKTLALVDSRDHLSVRFKEDFVRGGFKHFHEVKDDGKSIQEFSDRSKNQDCIFIALNFSDAQRYLEKLIANRWKGTVFGIGDWNMFSDEVRHLLKSTKYKGLKAYLPTGWAPDVSGNSKRFSEKIKVLTGVASSPIGAYSYDAMISGLVAACENLSLQDIPKLNQNRWGLLRQYDGIAETGNYLSKMLLIEVESGG